MTNYPATITHTPNRGTQVIPTINYDWAKSVLSSAIKREEPAGIVRTAARECGNICVYTVQK